MTISFTLQTYRELYFASSNKTLLRIDENQIHDFYNDVVYNWSDIEAIRQKHGYLYLTLYHPEDYLDKIGDWHYRVIKKLWYKPGGKHNEFSVNISLADANKDELSKLLYDYSGKKNRIMEFDVRQSGAFVFNILLVMIAGFMAVFSLLLFWNSEGFLHYSFIIWLIIALIRGYNYFNYFVLSVNKKPVLIINDTCISDEANQIKYYWDDIVAMREENLYLYIKVKNPEAYLQRITNPVRKFIIGASGPTFRLNLDLIKCDPEVLIELIDEANPTT